MRTLAIDIETYSSVDLVKSGAWEEFLKRVKNTRRTAETIAEFRNLPKISRMN